MTAPRRFRMAAVALLSFVAAGSAYGDDLHKLWDQRCGGCHGHAGTFSRDTLLLVDGRLGDRKGRDVEAFLKSHNGGYSPEVVAGIASMLRAQVETPDLFRRLCAQCHETAAVVARTLLSVEDGVLVGRQSHQPLAEVLRRHGDAEEDQQGPLLETLTRVEREVHHR